MSPRDWRLRISDILSAIDRIAEYTAGLSHEQFAADQKAIDAVEHNLFVIGEAARHVPPEVRVRHLQIPWADIVGMRNVLAHQYFETSVRIVFDTAERNLPDLALALRALLEREGTPDR